MNKTILLSLLIVMVSVNSAAQENSGEELVDGLNKKTFYKAVAFTGTYYSASMLILQKTWYRDRKTVPFHFYNDNRGYLQVDKFGHSFGAYLESYIGYHSLLHAGVARNKALLLGGSLGLVLQTPVEIMDGIHEGWGFSWGDMGANALGSGLIIGQELLFNEQVVRYKFSYWESKYARMANGYLGSSSADRLLEDYNGHTYWFSWSLNRLIPKSNIPAWLCVATGYGANGMFGEYENISEYDGVDIPETVRYRQFLVSLDIDWNKIKTRSAALKTLFNGLNFIKIPFPAFEYNTMYKFKWYWVYL